jgi:hypothetical protein
MRYHNLGMNYNSKDVEKYILLGYTPKSGRSIENSFLISGRWCCFWAIATLAIFHFVAIVNREFASIMFVNIVLILLIPATIFATIKLGNFGLKYFVNSKKQKRTNPYVVVASAIGATSGVLFGNYFFSRNSSSVSFIILSVMIVFLVLIFTMCAGINYYKVFLIRKYCPYLKER